MRRIAAAVALVILAVAAFFVGERLHRSEATPPATPTKTGSATGAARPQAGGPELVPVTETMAELPITTAPAPQVGAAEGARTDATAAGSSEYAAMAARARAEDAAADPRKMRGTFEGSAPVAVPRKSVATKRTQSKPAERAVTVSAPMFSASNENGWKTTAVLKRPEEQGDRTEPTPLVQPLPSIVVASPMTVRLDLTINEAGRVTDAEVVEGMRREVMPLLDMLPRWRFKPATRDGRPVPSHFAVDITFKPNE